jgi:hypothetical protein
MNHFIALVALTLASLAMPAMAQTQQWSPYFKTLVKTLPEGSYEAFEGWEEALRAHLADMLEEHGGDENAEAALPRMDFESDDELIGNWRVRSLQSDALGAYVYNWFPARIYREAQALVFDKHSGSQRHRGLMARASDDTVFFAGALYYDYQTPRLHSAFMDQTAAREVDPELDATALIHKLGPDHFLMVFDHEPNRFRFYEIGK